ncbi:uncharacterized protein [Halyomorpha halys]|uniref:uncharacterized protein isoform X2 n=1 Tax=Halyomorpha halys TaxID=286706 RepID=UPI000D0C93E1|nr:uncharacterized protein LOC106684828 isoform X2 [Halyomorpha halys]
MAGTNEEMLINLDSPEKNSNVVVHNHYLKNPLIPGPDLNFKELESNNPFDIVAQSAENWDPFELVLHQSLMNYEGSNKSCAESCGKLVDGDFFTRESNGRLNRSNSVSHNVKFFPTSEKQYEKPDEDILNLSSRSLDNSPSLRDRIKRVVKKRVGKCIERALNGTNQSETKHEIPTSKNVLYNLKSTSTNLEHQFLKYKKDESEIHDLSHILEEAKQLSVILNNLSINEEGCISYNAIANHSISNKTQKHSPLKENKKLLSDTKVHEDLMSVSPPWESGDTYSSDSDDNSIGLPKVKLFYVKKKEKKNEINHEKLAHYKKRIRASIDGNMSCGEDFNFQGIVSKTSLSNENKMGDEKLFEQQLDRAETEKSPTELKEKDTLGIAVSKPIVPVTNDLRLKKVGNILKKGPLKAIVPLQKMTKITDKISPLKKSSPNFKIKGKSCEDSTLSSSLISPMATSTPNSKNASNPKKNVGTSYDSTSRSRLSRKNNEHIGATTRRSVSLSTSSRKVSQTKQPFSSINPNVSNDNQKWKRPHTAPSQNTRVNLKSSTPLKKNVDRGYVELWVRSTRPALSLGVHSIPSKNSKQQLYFI